MLAKTGARLESKQQPQESSQTGFQIEAACGIALASGNYFVPAKMPWSHACQDYHKKEIQEGTLF